MNKSIYTAIYSVLLFALYFGVAIVFESCGGKKGEVDELNDLNSQLEGVADEHSSDAYFEDGDSGFESAGDATTSDVEYSVDDTDPGEVDYTAPVPQAQPKSNSTPTPSSSSSSYSNNTSSNKSSYSGAYMVIAGNYLVESNADEMVRKLKSAGYSSAEAVVFDLSQYYTVLAARYDSRSTASNTSEDLKRRGFDNYVLKSKN